MNSEHVIRVCRKMPYAVALAVLAAAALSPPASAQARTMGQADTPNAWPMYAMTPGHDARYVSAFPAVSWRYSVPGAASARASGLLNRTMIRDLVGFGIGVAVVDGTVYASNNDGYLYALDARNGQLRWRFHAFNQLMGTPIVATVDGRRLVFVGAGNSVFSYSHAVKHAQRQQLRGLA